MVATALLPAITETIRQNETSGQPGYELSYAKLGKSGASFGFMQGDTNVSQLARDTLRKALVANGVGAAATDRILAAVSKPLPAGNPLNATDTATADAALSSASGKPIVDAMDQTLFSKVLVGLDACISAAATRNMTLSPIAHLYIAPWINMSGPPTLIIAWLKGAAVHGVPAPTPPTVTEADVVAYLQATSYFQTHPKNFLHYHQCVEIGAKLLP